MSHRRLVVDAQLFQTPAWHRGMGKYSLELIASLLAAGGKKGWDSVEILLSSRAPQDPEMLNTIQKRLGGATVTHLELSLNEIGNSVLPELNRKKIDDYIAQTNQDNVATDFLILSLMQGEIASVFPSDPTVHRLLLFYDLIPLMFHDVYLKNPITRVEYLSKLTELFKADVYFAISKTVANDLSIYLGVDTSKIHSIDGGPIDHGQKSTTYNIAGPFILMPTGNDLRKNNQRAIIAFDRFNKEHDNIYTLVITSFFKPSQIVELSKLSNKVHFTGNISGEQLTFLYEKCDMVLFPPEYEGLGLPILEAMEQDKPIACSDISVFREMSRDAFHYFDPLSIESIKNTLEETAQKPGVNKKAYAEILDEYIWHKTANKLIDAIDPGKVELKKATKTPRLAVFGPDPSSSWLGKGVQTMHAEMSNLFATDYYTSLPINPYESRINYLPYTSSHRNMIPGMGFDPEEYDEVIHHIANDHAVASVLFSALATPGVLILHDTDLRVVWKAAEEQGLIDQSRTALEKEIDNEYTVPGAHLLSSLLNTQKAVIVFNSQAQKIVKAVVSKLGKNTDVVLASLPVAGLVYNSILPVKTIPKVNGEELTGRSSQSIRKITDFHLNEELARTKEAVINDSCPQQLVYEAMRFGVVPDLESESGKPVNLYPEIASLNTDSVLQYVKHSHNQPQFSKALQDLIIKVSTQESANA